MLYNKYENIHTYTQKKERRTYWLACVYYTYSYYVDPYRKIDVCICTNTVRIKQICFCNLVIHPRHSYIYSFCTLSPILILSQFHSVQYVSESPSSSSSLPPSFCLFSHQKFGSMSSMLTMMTMMITVIVMTLLEKERKNRIRKLEKKNKLTCLFKKRTRDKSKKLHFH